MFVIEKYGDLCSMLSFVTNLTILMVFGGHPHMKSTKFCSWKLNYRKIVIKHIHDDIVDSLIIERKLGFVDCCSVEE